MASDPSKSWLPDVMRAILSFNGEAHLSQIYRWIRHHRENLPAEWHAVVRATIQHHSTDSKSYVIGNPDAFQHTGRGIWALRRNGEVMFGKSDYALVSQVLRALSDEQKQSFDGRSNEFVKFIQNEVARLKRQYGMG